MSASNRATNGHRFVFHSNEVSGTERHYVQDEPGVVPFDPPPPTPPNPQYILYPSPPQRTYPFQTQASSSAGPSSSVFRADYLPTPPLEFASPEFLSPPRHRSHDHDPSPVRPLDCHRIYPLIKFLIIDHMLSNTIVCKLRPLPVLHPLLYLPNLSIIRCPTDPLLLNPWFMGVPLHYLAKTSTPRIKKKPLSYSHP